MTRGLAEIAADLDALNETLRFTVTELDRVIRGLRGEPSVMDQPGAKFEFFAEDGRPLDLASLANEVRAHSEGS